MVEYDNVPENEDYEDNAIIIYEDVQGNIDIDQYFLKSQVPALKQFLESQGYKAYYHKHPKSFEMQKEFRSGKPFVMKNIAHDIDWKNSEVVKKVLHSCLVLKKENDVVLKEALVASGRDPRVSKQTGFAIQSRFKDLTVGFIKWINEQKRDMNLIEQNITDYAVIYAEQERTKNSSVIPIGTRVRFADGEDMIEGNVVEYDDEDKTYKVKDDEGYGHLGKKRKELERI